ncbi:MAG: hypothetical protein AAF439_03310, partial [Pseudomonadota bacterium]
MTIERPRIIGMGHCLPGTVRTNEDPIFAPLRKGSQEETDELFYGFERRHVLTDGENVVGLMVPAAMAALEQAEVEPADIDLLIGDASISKHLVPNQLSEVHKDLKLPARCLSLPLVNAFSQFNVAVMMADSLIAAGRAQNILIVMGANWTRHVDYATPQAISAGDAAAACVMGMSKDASKWAFEGHLVLSETEKYFGGMHMSRTTKKVPADAGLPGTLIPDDATFHITKTGADGFKDIGLERGQGVVLKLLKTHKVDPGEAALITHQASEKLTKRWQDDIDPACYVDTLKRFGNMVHATVPFNLSWGQDNFDGFTQRYVATLCLGP